jgi:hypothetical protein
MKLTQTQKQYLKTIEKKKNRKKIKKLFIKTNKEKPIEDCKLLLHDILNILTNPFFLKT